MRSMRSPAWARLILEVVSMVRSSQRSASRNSIRALMAAIWNWCRESIRDTLFRVGRGAQGCPRGARALERQVRRPSCRGLVYYECMEP